MDMTIEHCPSTVDISDYITMFGEKTAHQTRLVFNPTKCKIKVKEIKFFGFVFNAKDVHPDKKKNEDYQRDLGSWETPSLIFVRQTL